MGDGHFEQLQSLLHAGSAGDGKPGGARDDRPAKPGTVSGGNYGVLAPGLSQLTDLLLEHARAAPVAELTGAQAKPAVPGAAPEPSDAASAQPPTLLGPSSQPDTQTPQLLESQGPASSGAPAGPRPSRRARRRPARRCPASCR